MAPSFRSLARPVRLAGLPRVGQVVDDPPQLGCTLRLCARHASLCRAPAVRESESWACVCPSGTLAAGV